MNLQTVEQIVALLDTHGVAEIDAEMGSERVHARRAHLPMPAPPAFVPDALLQAAEDAPPDLPNTWTLTAPMVGIFHQARPPVSVGTTIQAAQKIGFIEAMKLMNDVPAEEGGRVLEVLTEDGGPVEYGQPLLRLSRL